MAGRGISIDILANVRDALKGTGDVEKALADIESTLEDMARSGDQSVDKMSRGFRDLARDADTSADKVERSYRDAYRSVSRRADDAADDAVRSQRRIGERSAEVGQEVRQNLGEGIANAARGDFESLADTIGDTFGGAVAGIGGLGTAALGVAGALGLGAIVAVFQNIQAEQEKLQERTKEWAEGYIEAGSDVLGAAQITANGLRILSDRHAELTENARNWGVSEDLALRAMSGAPEALEYVAQALDRKREAAAKDADEARRLAEANGSGLNALTQMEREVLKGEDALNKQREAMGRASEQASTYSEFLKNVVLDAGTATEEVDEFGNRLLTLPDGKQVLIDAETGQATDNVDRFKGDVDGIPETVTTTAYFRVNTAEFDAAKRRIEREIQVNVRPRALPGQGRFLE